MFFMFCMIHNKVDFVFSVPTAAKSPMKMLYIYADCRAKESSLQNGVSETVKSLMCLEEHLCAFSAGTSALGAAF